jgi:hypothetical protein
MKMYLALMLVVVSCGLDTALAQEPGKTMRATGRVVAIDSESITVKPGHNTLVLVVDASTRVTGKGVGTKLRSLKADKKSAQITDLVDENDSVVAEYRDLGNGVLQATRVDVRVKAFKKK